MSVFFSDNAPVLRDFRIVVNNYARHFPRGVIGRVPVTDRDATAKLEYRITSGNRHSLLLVNPANGEMQLSASLNSDVPYSAQFTIEVSGKQGHLFMRRFDIPSSP